MIPDGEKLVSNYLRAYPGMDSRFVGKTPSDLSSSWVRVTQLDAPSGVPDHLVEFYFQLDCYATIEGGQPEANELGRKVRAALELMPGAHDEGVVTGTMINGDARVPDTEMGEPARERKILTVTVWAHS